MLKMLMFSIAVVAVDASLAVADARYLVLANDTRVTAVMTIERPGVAGHFILRPSESIRVDLSSSKDDRVLIARKTGTPSKVLATSQFNPGDTPFETIGAFLIQDEQTGLYQFLFWAGVGEEMRPLDTSEAGQKLFGQHREQLLKALDNKAEAAAELP